MSQDCGFEWIEQWIIRVGAATGDLTSADHGYVLDAVYTFNQLPHEHNTRRRVLNAGQGYPVTHECIEPRVDPRGERSVTYHPD